MEERGAALMEEGQMETVGRGTGGEESSSLLARTWCGETAQPFCTDVLQRPKVIARHWFNIKAFMLGLLDGFTCLYRVSLEGGDVQSAIAGLAASRGIRSCKCHNSQMLQKKKNVKQQL